MKNVQFELGDVGVSLSLFSNTLLCVISEVGKFGSLVEGVCEV